MSLKNFVLDLIGEKEEIVSITPPPTELKERVEDVVEELDVKIEVPTERTVTEKSELNFVGSFNYVPDPIEYNEGSIYKNINEGVAYIRKGLLWEELVRDGKPGRDAARVGGSGVGVAEVKSITGMLGIFDSKVELDKIDTTNLKIGTIATLPSGPVTWHGAAGWVANKVLDVTSNPIRAAVASCIAGISDFRICAQGDSISAGFSLNTTTHYSGRLAQAIARLIGVPVGYGHTLLRSGNNANPTPANSIVTVGAGWSYVAWIVPFYGQTGMNAPIGTATSIDVAFPETLDSVNVLWAVSTATGDLVYSWNGGSKTTITRPSPTADVKYVVTNIPAPSRGTHTLNLWQPASGSRSNYVSVEPQDSTTRKVRVVSTGMSGSCIATMVPYFAATAADTAADAISAMKTDLLVVEIGTNDQKQNAGFTSGDAWGNNLRSIVSGQLSRTSYKTQILVMSLYDHATSGVYTPGVSDFVGRAQKVAIESNALFCDLQSRWVDYATTSANAYLYDTLHPGAKGSADIGSALYEALGIN